MFVNLEYFYSKINNNCKMRNLTLLISALMISIFASQAQKLESEAIYKPESLTKDSYIGSVDYDPETEHTSLYYVEKDVIKTSFKTYKFDESLDFIKEEIETYKLGGDNGSSEDLSTVRKKYSWFNFKKERYTSEFVSVSQGLGGKIIARKQKVTYVYNWFLGQYVPVYEPAQTVKIKSETDDKIYLYDGVVDSETGSAYVVVGQKAPKGSDEKYKETRHFQIVKITYDLEVEYLEEFSFDYNMAISYNTIFYNADAEPIDGAQFRDIKNGKWYMIFSPIKSLRGRKTVNPKAGESRMVIVNEDGSIDAQIDFNAPAAGWVIDDVAFSGNDIYFYGPAIAGKYINQVKPTISPLTIRGNVKESKYKEYQVMKISNNKLAYINATNIKKFKKKLKNPPSQRRSPDYRGKKFIKSITHITENGELFIGGQNWEIVYNPITEEKVTKYTDLIMFHFDSQGELISQYGIRRDKNNKHSRANVTPQYLYEVPETGNVYWVYGEIKGLRRGFEVGGIYSALGVGTLSKKKLLYYPAVAKISKDGSIGDFLFLGTNDRGKPEYFTNPNVPQILSRDGKKLIFVGEDKKGKEIWLAKVAID